MSDKLTPAEAEKLVFENITPFHREDCPLAGAQGRVLRTVVDGRTVFDAMPAAQAEAKRVAR